MVYRGKTFTVGETVTVLTVDEFVFVGNIVDCKAKLKCECCDDDHRGKDKDKCDHDFKDKKDDCDCDCYLVLSLEEDVENDDDVFQEGQLVFINFCQIIAIGCGVPPNGKGKGD